MDSTGRESASHSSGKNPRNYSLMPLLPLLAVADAVAVAVAGCNVTDQAVVTVTEVAAGRWVG